MIRIHKKIIQRVIISHIFNPLNFAEGHHDPAQPVRTLSDDEIAEIVDAVLKEDDLTGDGYVEYSEFVVAQRKARGNTPSPPKAQDHPSGQH